MVESIYFLKPAWCGTHFAGLWPEQGLQPVTGATALRRWFVTYLFINEIRALKLGSRFFGGSVEKWAGAGSGAGFERLGVGVARFIWSHLYTGGLGCLAGSR